MRNLILGFWFFLALASCAPLSAQGLRPHEPLNPAKAQSLPMSLLTIESGAARHTFTVELADTDTERSIGMMHRTQMAADHGMLFDFQREERLRFWMRNTFISLDLIFIGSDGRIIGIAEKAVPHSESPIGPAKPAQAVLEVVGGTAARLGLKRGDVVRHAIFKN